MKRLNQQRNKLGGMDLVSGMALATGDRRHKHWEPPATSAVPLTEVGVAELKTTTAPSIFLRKLHIHGDSQLLRDGSKFRANGPNGTGSTFGFQNDVGLAIHDHIDSSGMLLCWLTRSSGTRLLRLRHGHIQFLNVGKEDVAET